MGDTNGKHQEWHQHRVRIEPEAQGVQQAKLPGHGDQRGNQYRDGALQATGKPQQQGKGDADGYDEEERNTDQPVDQVTDLLGEADDVNLHIRVLRLVLVANLLFQLVGELLVVQLDLLAAIFRIRVGLHQRHVDDAGLEVIGDQTPDLTGLENVAAKVIETFRRPVIGLRNDLTAGEALLCHLGPANAGTPKRLHVGAIDTLDIEHFVMNLPQRFHVVLGEDVTIFCCHGNPHRVAEVGQIILVLEHLLDIRMPQRNHLLEAGLRPNLGRLIEEKCADQQAEYDDCRPVVEDQALEERRRLLVVLGHADSPGFIVVWPDPRPMARRCEHHPALPGSGCLGNRR